MIQKSLYVEPHEFLIEPSKSNGICLVFEEGVNPSDYVIESVINWAKSPRTLGFTEDPYDIEFDEAAFGDGIEVQIKWGQDVDVVPYEVIDLTYSFLNTQHPNSGCEEVQVCVSMGKSVITH